MASNKHLTQFNTISIYEITTWTKCIFNGNEDWNTKGISPCQQKNKIYELLFDLVKGNLLSQHSI